MINPKIFRRSGRSIPVIPCGLRQGIVQDDCGSRRFLRRPHLSPQSTAACDAAKCPQRWWWIQTSRPWGISRGRWLDRSSTSTTAPGRHPGTSTRHCGPPAGRSPSHGSAWPKSRLPKNNIGVVFQGGRKRQVVEQKFHQQVSGWKKQRPIYDVRKEFENFSTFDCGRNWGGRLKHTNNTWRASNVITVEANWWCFISKVRNDSQKLGQEFPHGQRICGSQDHRRANRKQAASPAIKDKLTGFGMKRSIKAKWCRSLRNQSEAVGEFDGRFFLQLVDNVCRVKRPFCLAPFGSCRNFTHTVQEVYPRCAVESQQTLLITGHRIGITLTALVLHR